MNTFFKNFLTIYSILLISDSSSVTEKYFVLAITAIVLGYFIFRRDAFSKKIITFFIVWFIINMAALIINGGTSIPFFKIVSFSIVYFLYPYLVLKYVGSDFWILLEKWIFTLTKVSIPIFIFNFLFPSLFSSLYPIFSILTSSSFEDPFWSSLIYVHGNNIEGLIRNSGFMWEPGAFAMMIVFGISFSWLKNGVKYDKHFFIYTVAMITTFSTAGFIAFAILIIGGVLKRISLMNIIILCALSFLFSNQIYEQDFMKGKLDIYLATYEENELNFSEEYGLYKVNRFQGAYYSVIETKEYPFGYGVIAKKDYSNGIEIYGTNGLGSMLKMWGIIFFIYFLFLLNKTLHFFDMDKSKKVLIYSIYASLLVMFFSNPISRNVFIYFLILTPLMFKKTKTKLNKNNI